MPVLKQHHNTPAMREAIVLDLGDIGAQAARIRAAAETQAAKIVADAQAKSEALADQLHDEAEKQGYSDGMEKGFAEGREQGRAEALAESAEQLRQLSAAWFQVASDWEQQRTEMEREARQAVLDFALSAAEKLVHRVIEVDETVVVDQAAQALSLVMSSHDASVRIHPVDRPMLEDALPDLLSELSNMEHIELVDDEEITPGGCIVAFGQGRIDATIERQLERLINLILPEPPQPVIDEQETQPEIHDQQTEHASAEATAIAPDVPVLDDPPPAPVYEITEQGLVETTNALPVEPVDGVDDTGETQTPDSEPEPEE